MAKTTRKAPSSEAGITDQAAQAFAHLAERIEAVAAVAVLPSEDGVSVWTLLDGDPNGSARQAVYRIELVTQQEYPAALLDFRVINAGDFPPQRRDELLPTQATRLFERPVGAARLDDAGRSEPAVAASNA